MVTASLAFVQRDNDPLEKLVNAMHKWTESVPQEKVYIHMDKPYYALGDIIWFKAYVTIGSRHQLSAISGALYVDLINEKDSIASALKLRSYLFNKPIKPEANPLRISIIPGLAS